MKLEAAMKKNAARIDEAFDMINHRGEPGKLAIFDMIFEEIRRVEKASITED